MFLLLSIYPNLGYISLAFKNVADTGFICFKT